MPLRDYQAQTVAAIYDYLRATDRNPLAVVAVGGGKSWIIAQIAADVVQLWGGRVLIVTHSAELVAQNAAKVRALCPTLDVGVFCAGLNRRDTEPPVLCASIQSIHGRACDVGRRELVIVDEAHAIPADNESLYRRFLADAKVINPDLRLCGLTATPFRLSSGSLCQPDGLFQEICFDVGLRQLIADGHLVPLVTKAGAVRVDIDRLRVRGGEFVADEVETLMDQDAVVEAACAEIVEQTENRNCCLIFCCGVRHGEHVRDVIQKKFGAECGFVSAATPHRERDELLTRFGGACGGTLFGRSPLKYLVNHGILTTGYDNPRLDAIALMRPTMSAGLLVQMCGRGTRLHPGKSNCMILDFGQNFLRHGPLDLIGVNSVIQRSGTGQAPAKECPQCRTVVAAGHAACPDCGFEFPRPERAQHDATASSAGILSGQVTDTEYEVRDVWYSLHTKRGADESAPRTLRVNYRLGLEHWQSEWICVEHTGYARRKAAAWWAARTDEPLPDTALEAVAFAQGGGLAVPEAITVRSISGEKFDRIVDYRLGAKPDAVECALEEIPF